MPIDVTNRNPSDPNGVASISSNQVPAWVSDDWNTLTLDPAEGQAKKLHEVRVVRVTTNDGREFRAVLGADGQPMSVIGDTTGIDKDQAAHWQQAGPKPIAPGGTPTQRRQAPDGLTHIYGYNPTTGQYDDDQGAVQGQATTPHVEGTPTGQKDADGNPIFDNTKPIMVERDAQGRQVGPAKPLTAEQRQQWEREKNGGRTDAENQTATDEQPVPNRPGWVQVTTKQGANSSVRFRGPDGNLVDALPGMPTTVSASTTEPFIVERLPDGTLKTTANPNYQGVRPTHSTTTVNGVAYVVTVDKDGKATAKPIEGLPSEGAATAGGPRMPEIVVGASEQTLRTYHQALQDDPSLTPAQREKRFQEAVQIANVAVQEATTQQRERESVRNADYNAATQRLSYLQGGMGQALDYATKLNATLDPGSDLGGKAFAAILGLQLIQMNQSGINGLPSLTRPATPTPTLTARDLSDPQALSAKNAEIAAHAAQVAAGQAGQPLPANGQARPGDPPARANVPAQPATSAATAAPAPAATTLPPNRPDQTQAAAQIEGAINPPSVYPSPPGMPDPNDPNIGHPGDPGYQAPPMKMDPPDYGQPGMQVLPQPATTPPLPSGEVTMAPPSDPTGGFAVMQQLQPPMAPPSAAPATTTPMDEPPAMRAARIKVTVPWQLSDSDLQWAHDNGLLDHAMAVPGMAA